MKKLLLLTLLFSILLSYSCSEDEPCNCTNKITASLVDSEGCKGFESETILTDEFPRNVTAVRYDYDSELKLLKLKHFNAAFNCCVKRFYTEVSVTDNKIIVHEKADIDPCDCNCLYDLESHLTRIEPQTYYIQFDEGILHENDPIFFEINLNEKTSGEFTYQRNGYPWGS
jgi:hypothetical protein